MVQYWGQFDDGGHMVGVLMRYHVLWYVHDGPGTDLGILAQAVESQRQRSIIVNDNVRAGRSLVAQLGGYRVVLDLVGRLHRLPRERLVPHTAWHQARQATLDDAERLVEFYARAPEDVRRGPDSVRRSLSGGRRTFVVEVSAEISAAALTTAELPTVAMIGGWHAVSQPGDEERLASVLTGLAQALLAEGKQACLVARDRRLDAICERMGFDDLGPWRTVHLSRCREAKNG